MDWLSDDNGKAVVAAVRFEVEDGTKRRATVDFVRPIDDVEDARVSDFYSGIGDWIRQSEEEIASHKITTTPLKKDRLISLGLSCDASQDLPAFKFSGSGKIRAIQVTLRTKIRTQLVRVVLSGVDVSECAALVGLMERTCHVTVSQIQPTLPLTGRSAGPVAPEVGQLVTARGPNGTVVGLVGAVSGEAVRVDDFGVITTVQTSEIATVSTLGSGDSEEVLRHLMGYRDGADATDRAPSWSVLIEALSEGWASGSIPRPPAGTILISGAVVDAALTRHVRAGALPPEAGEDGHEPEPGDGGSEDPEDARDEDVGTDARGRAVRRRRGGS